MTDIASVVLWHRRARPKPDHEALNVQLGCHFEEIAEMLVALKAENAATVDKLAQARFLMMKLADGFKMGLFKAYIEDEVEFLDSLCDQIVTAAGVGYCAGMDVEGGMTEVNSSNWSKFDENGQPIRDKNGKISKGPRYRKPELGGFVRGGA